mmetsp:Transcript_77386/g.250457  ORF Transcript_77386/g.250457 Transcript_77386/m.250457 type:complete len:265 (+) Transcript_77386:255-1049(+)
MGALGGKHRAARARCGARRDDGALLGPRQQCAGAGHRRRGGARREHHHAAYAAVVLGHVRRPREREPHGPAQVQTPAWRACHLGQVGSAGQLQPLWYRRRHWPWVAGDGPDDGVYLGRILHHPGADLQDGRHAEDDGRARRGEAPRDGHRGAVRETIRAPWLGRVLGELLELPLEDVDGREQRLRGGGRHHRRGDRRSDARRSVDVERGAFEVPREQMVQLEGQAGLARGLGEQADLGRGPADVQAPRAFLRALRRQWRQPDRL